jgi:hypothetical protein
MKQTKQNGAAGEVGLPQRPLKLQSNPLLVENPGLRAWWGRRMRLDFDSERELGYGWQQWMGPRRRPRRAGGDLRRDHRHRGVVRNAVERAGANGGDGKRRVRNVDRVPGAAARALPVGAHDRLLRTASIMHLSTLSNQPIIARASPQGLAVTVRSAPCLSVEAAVGVFVRVLAGEAWVTTDGTPRDTIVECGAILPLEPGTRFTFTAFRDQTTMLFTASRRRADVDFRIRTREGMRWLTISAGGNRVGAVLARAATSIWALARHRLALLPPQTFSWK